MAIEPRPVVRQRDRLPSSRIMATTDWVRFAELVNEMGQLIDAGQTDGPELERVVTEADAIFHGSEPVSDALDESFVIDDPWSLLEGLNGSSKARSPQG